ncbi:MAG TPA: aminotransferase class V-fold PLP-dependent enzyme [Thermoanaerobaculia bacterium]|nr:aminotransferase class V-fold PLP-dependent enzyme [Thermoanaerobaculia bacterium]
MELKKHWLLDPDIAFLNHGSYGATPIAVLARQDELRTQMEREPVRFFNRELEPLLDDARRRLAAFLGADEAGLAFCANATAGVNAVLRSLDLDKLDELVVTSHEYNASRNTIDFAAGLAGAKVVVVTIPFPIASPDEVMERILAAVTDRTRLVLIDHVTSQTALVFPAARIVSEVQARGVDVLIDGAHAPGMIPLDLRAIGAAYYAGNLHKWVCAPKGAGFLHVRENRRLGIHPAVISHGMNATRRDRSRYHLEFDWTGTMDPTPWLCVPVALRFMESLVEGGWPEIMRRNHDLALRARDLLCQRLAIANPAPDDMLGSMAAIPLPEGDAQSLQDELFFEHHIEVPLMPWPTRLLRVSAQLYNTIEEYERLADALRRAGETPALLHEIPR